MNLLKEIVQLPSGLINAFYGHYAGGEKRPIYFDVNDLKPELNKIEQNFDIVKNEYKNVEQLGAIPAYEELDKFQTDPDKPPTKWKVFVLQMMGEYDEAALTLCPQICEMVKSIPGVFQAMFSVLEPGRSIPAHKGPYLMKL